MKKLLISIVATIALFSFSTTLFAQAASSYVSGYFKKNGTYVQGYYRTAPNNTRLDNFSTKGNYNPYTGKYGTVSPYKSYTTPSYKVPTYKSPTYKYPTYTVPKYSTPSYKLPSYKSPSYSFPSYKTPSYSYPTYKSIRW